MEENLLSADTRPTDETNSIEEVTPVSKEEVSESDATEEQEYESVSAPEESGKSSGDELMIRYNHKDITLSKDEAKNYAQMGMYYEKQGIGELFSKLSDFAEKNGVSVEELLDGISDECSSIKGDQVTAEVQPEERLADEFIELQEEFSDIKSFSQLPEPVKKAAAEGENLITAYLYHLHTQNKIIAEAKANAERAAKSSTGSVSSTDTESGVNNAFIAALWGS